MKNLWIVLAFLVFLFPTILALKNPAAVYCESLGFQYTLETNADNSVSSFCVIKDAKYPAWDFYSGKVAKEFSYCAQNGYNLISVEGGKFSPVSGACVNKSVSSTREITDEDYILQEDAMNIELILQEEENLAVQEGINSNVILNNNQEKTKKAPRKSSSSSSKNSINEQITNSMNTALTNTKNNLVKLNPVRLLNKSPRSKKTFFFVIMPLSLLGIVIFRRRK